MEEAQSGRERKGSVYTYWPGPGSNEELQSPDFLLEETRICYVLGGLWNHRHCWD